jgi:tetratricopeptide (TPR) repeat protein
VTLPRRTLVEIFADQGDFAVRTFGMPGNPGYLGVCFGSVITANSPAAQSGPVNWEAVLWHEFCHTITLTMTRNRMPRWLSEGISVYEEKIENSTWGQDMTPRYRSMILEGELTPISELSAAFLAPRSDQHLQFAYYQSSLVVEYLVDRFGMEAIRAILHDLGEGEPINDSIERHTTALEELEVDFEEFARKRAEGLAPGLDWDTPDDSVLDKELWATLHPRSFQVLTERALELIGEKKYGEAKEPLNLLLEEYPGYTGGNNAYSMLALAHRELGETDAERAVLSRLAARSADATDAYLRLMELGEGAGDWRAVEENANRYLAVNPLVPPPHAYLGRASEALDQPERAAEAYRVLLMLDPPDPAEAHFRLARVLHRTGDPAAKRQVLMALEEAPRFRDAHRLLLELHEADDADPGVPESQIIFGPTLPSSEPPRAEP